MQFQAKYITEDLAAHGAVLAFPNVSTCVAVVLNLGNELVGWHVTTGTLADVDTRKACAQGAAKFIEYANGATNQNTLYIVGHVSNHDPAALRDWVRGQLGVQVPVFSFDITQHRKAVMGGEYTIVFRHNGPADPSVTFKKSIKTVANNIQGGDANAPGGLAPNLARGYLPFHDQDADFTMKNVHSLRQNWVQL